jgi:hypothetical protein
VRPRSVTCVWSAVLALYIFHPSGLMGRKASLPAASAYIKLQRSSGTLVIRGMDWGLYWKKRGTWAPGHLGSGSWLLQAVCARRSWDICFLSTYLTPPPPLGISHVLPRVLLLALTYGLAIASGDILAVSEEPDNDTRPTTQLDVPGGLQW